MIYKFLNSLRCEKSKWPPLRKKAFENIVGKGENAGKQLFFLFPQCCPPFQFQTLSHIHFVVCKCFQFGPAQDHPYLIVEHLMFRKIPVIGDVSSLSHNPFF